MEKKVYDLIILGGGPASMSAGIYASQMKLDTLLIEKDSFGGQITTTSSISNYPGFTEISGEELSLRMHNHLTSTNINISREEVTKTILNEDIKQVHTHNNIYYSKSVIIGIGTRLRNLGVDNENYYLGKGLSYLALKDGDKFLDRDVAVIGGGNSAIEDALFLSEKCRKVYLVHRRQQFRGDEQLIEQLHNKSNIELVLEHKPIQIVGKSRIEKLILKHIPSDSIRELNVDAIFVAIGRGADTDVIDENIARDNNGYIITNQLMETNLSGVYAIGDIRNTPLRQIVTALSDGAIASVSANKFIRNIK